MFLDSSAWIEYFMGTEKGTSVRKTVEGSGILYTSPIVIAEIYSKSVRTDGVENAEIRKDFILKRCVLVPDDEKIAVEAGRIHAEMKKKAEGFGLADALIVAAARKKGAKVLTGDKHLKALDDVEML